MTAARLCLSHEFTLKVTHLLSDCFAQCLWEPMCKWEIGMTGCMEEFPH